MSKKLISLLLAVMLTVSMVAVAAVSVSAETSDDTASVAAVADTDKAEVPSVGDAYLSVNATSNLLGNASAQYNAETNEVVVTYYFAIGSEKKVENIQYDLTYDTDIFEVPNGYDPVEDWYTDYSSDIFGYDGMVNLDDPGHVNFNVSNVNNGFEAKDGSVLLQLKLKVKDGINAPATTTINMEVVSMLVAQFRARKVVVGSEEHVAYKSLAHEDTIANNNITTSTTLSESTYVPEPTTTEPVPTTTVEPEPTTTEPVPTTTEPVPTSTVADEMTVTAISNIGTNAEQTGLKTGDKFVVNYYISPEKNVMATQWKLSYDDSKLKLLNVDMPQIADGVLYNDSVSGEIQADGSNLNLYSIDSSVPFVTAKFEVIADPANAEASTTVDLRGEILLLAEKNEDGSVNEESEEYAIIGGVVDSALLGNVATEIVFDEPEPTTTAPVPTETTPVPTETTPVPTETTPVPTETTPVPTTTVPVPSTTVEPEPTTTATVPATTVAPQTTTAVAPATTVADATSATGSTKPANKSTSDTAVNNNNSNSGSSNAVQTGEASMAVIILTILVVATGVMFVLRRKDLF